MSKSPAERAPVRPPRTIALNPGDRSQDCDEYAVIGEYSETDGTFVKHVALLSEAVSLTADSEVDVWHMGPPIGGGKMRAHLVADVGLTQDEKSAMRNWRAKVDKEKRPQVPFKQYVVHPPVRWERSEKGRRMYRRFSCVGYVIDCYANAGIDTVDDDAELPEVDAATLAKAYPDLHRFERLPGSAQERFGYEGRKALGIAGEGPWRIALPGYIFHALQRATAEQPRPPAFVPSTAAQANFR